MNRQDAKEGTTKARRRRTTKSPGRQSRNQRNHSACKTPNAQRPTPNAQHPTPNGRRRSEMGFRGGRQKHRNLRVLRSFSNIAKQRTRSNTGEHWLGHSRRRDACFNAAQEKQELRKCSPLSSKTCKAHIFLEVASGCPHACPNGNSRRDGSAVWGSESAIPLLRPEEYFIFIKTITLLSCAKAQGQVTLRGEI